MTFPRKRAHARRQRGSQGYPPGYYAAFVLDPDGDNMEAVFRES